MMRVPYEIRGGLTRLAILVSACLLIAFLIPPLKVYHFTPFNSGISIVIAVPALIWIVYSVLIWVAEGLKR